MQRRFRRGNKGNIAVTKSALGKIGGSHLTVNRHSGTICCACSNAGTPCLSHWERWPSEARTERGNALSVTFGDSSPRGRAKGLYRYATLTVLRPSSKKTQGGFCYASPMETRKNMERTVQFAKSMKKRKIILYNFSVMKYNAAIRHRPDAN